MAISDDNFLLNFQVVSGKDATNYTVYKDTSTYTEHTEKGCALYISAEDFERLSKAEEAGKIRELIRSEISERDSYSCKAAVAGAVTYVAAVIGIVGGIYFKSLLVSSSMGFVVLLSGTTAIISKGITVNSIKVRLLVYRAFEALLASHPSEKDLQKRLQESRNSPICLQEEQ